MAPDDVDHLAHALQFIEKAGNAKEFSIQCSICSPKEPDVNLAGISGATLPNCNLKFTISIGYCCGMISAALKGRCSGEVKKLDFLAMAADVAPVVEEAEDRDEVSFTVTRPHSSS
jgi:hypothetical protein